MCLSSNEVDEASPHVTLAVKIIDDIVPRLFNNRICIDDRISEAYVWNKLLCDTQGRCLDVPENLEEWGYNHVKIVAKSLLECAIYLLKSAMEPGNPPAKDQSPLTEL